MLPTMVTLYTHLYASNVLVMQLTTLSIDDYYIQIILYLIDYMPQLINFYNYISAKVKYAYTYIHTHS